jgi:hypothetical protein
MDPTRVFCSSCGVRLQESARFCSSCGAGVVVSQPIASPFSRPTAPASLMTPPEARNSQLSRTVRFMLLGVALFIVWFMVWAWLNVGSKEPIGGDSGSSTGQRFVPDAEYCKNFPFDEKCPNHEQHAAPVTRQSDSSIEEDDKGKRRQALALAFEEVMRQQGHEVSVSATSDQLWFDCSSALEPRSSCYAAYQSSKHLPSDLKAELRAVGITTLNFSPNGGMIPTWATNIK